MVLFFRKLGSSVGYAFAWGVETQRTECAMACELMKCRWSLTFHEGVARPAAWGSRARNQDGMGCVCVSMRVAVEKSNVGDEVEFVEISAMEDKASAAKWRTLMSMP